MSANFNYNSLSPAMSSNLQEIARMAWGSGVFEGKSGGAGRMGVLYDNNNNPRIIKFNTRSIERSFGQSVASNSKMMESADNLRMMLRDITDFAVNKGLPPKVRDEIYAKLGLGANGELKEHTGNETGKDLLSRKVVAQVVSKLGGDQIWKDAWLGHDKSYYSTSGNKNTQLKNVWTNDIKSGVQSTTVRTMDRMLGKDFNEDIVKLLSEQGKSSKEGLVQRGTEFLKGHAALRGMFDEGTFDGLSETVFLEAVQNWSRSDYKAGMDENAVKTTFTAALQNAQSMSLKSISKFGMDEVQLQGLGLKFSDLKSAINNMAGNFGLNASQQQTVAKMTMAYLAAKLGDAESRGTLPNAGNLLAQIRSGKFEGTCFGLAVCGVKAKEIKLPCDDLYHERSRFIGSLPKDEGSVEKMAFLLGKMKGNLTDYPPAFWDKLIKERDKLSEKAGMGGQISKDIADIKTGVDKAQAKVMAELLNKSPVANRKKMMELQISKVLTMYKEFNKEARNVLDDDSCDEHLLGDCFRDWTMNDLTKQENKIVNENPQCLPLIRTVGRYHLLNGKMIRRSEGSTECKDMKGLQDSINNFFTEMNVTDPKMKVMLRLMMSQGPGSWLKDVVQEGGLFNGPVPYLNSGLTLTSIKPAANGGFDVYLQSTFDGCGVIKGEPGYLGDDMFFDPWHDNTYTASCVLHVGPGKEGDYPTITCSEPLKFESVDVKTMTLEECESQWRSITKEAIFGEQEPKLPPNIKRAADAEKAIIKVREKLVEQGIVFTEKRKDEIAEAVVSKLFAEYLRGDEDVPAFISDLDNLSINVADTVKEAAQIDFKVTLDI